jgi:hypothetical protein
VARGTGAARRASGKPVLHLATRRGPAPLPAAAPRGRRLQAPCALPWLSFGAGCLEQPGPFRPPKAYCTAAATSAARGRRCLLGTQPAAEPGAGAAGPAPCSCCCSASCSRHSASSRASMRDSLSAAAAAAAAAARPLHWSVCCCSTSDRSRGAMADTTPGRRACKVARCRGPLIGMVRRLVSDPLHAPRGPGEASQSRSPRSPAVPQTADSSATAERI